MKRGETLMNKQKETYREGWSSNIGFVLAAAGSAIGLGNLWKFPYLVGKNGGGAFVFIYLIVLVVLGFSLTLGEIAIGRKGKLDAFGSYNKIKKGWGFIGLIGIACCFLIYSYYVIICRMDNKISCYLFTRWSRKRPSTGL